MMDGVSMTRRGAMLFTGTAALSLLSGGAAAEHTAEDSFHGTAVLIGTSDQRPEPGDPFFDDKTAYQYLYLATDEGGRYTISTGESEWTQQPLHLVETADEDLPAPTEVPPGYMVLDKDRGVPGWNDGDNFEWANFVDDVLTSPVTVADTTTRTVVWEPDINAHSLITGRIYQIDLHGVFSTANTSDQFTVDVNIGGTDAAELQNAGQNATDAPWTLEVTFTVRADGQNGLIKPNTRATFDEQPRTARHDEISVDTTTATNLAIAIQWSSADPDNSVTLEQAHLKQMG